MEDTFQILATDYTSYSIEYQCDPNGILPKRGELYEDKTGGEMTNTQCLVCWILITVAQIELQHARIKKKDINDTNISML